MAQGFHSISTEHMARYARAVDVLRRGLLQHVMDSGVQDSGIAMDALVLALQDIASASGRMPELRMALASLAANAPQTPASTWTQKH